MADAERTDYHTDILPRDKSMVDMYRVATYIHQIPAALEIVKDATDKGYETTINLMAVSTVPESELESGLEVLAQSPAKALYVVDSFGTFYSEQIRDLVHRFQKYTKPAGMEIGIHTHNNLQLAFANTIEAIVLGRTTSTPASAAWAAARAMPRSCAELPAQPKFKMRPILEELQKNVEPMREELRWALRSVQCSRLPQPASAHRDEVHGRRQLPRHREVLRRSGERALNGAELRISRGARKRRAYFARAASVCAHRADREGSWARYDVHHRQGTSADCFGGGGSGCRAFCR
jgi:hypothetical protein